MSSTEGGDIFIMDDTVGGGGGSHSALRPLVRNVLIENMSGS
jgi:hypothetical protein